MYASSKIIWRLKCVLNWCIRYHPFFLPHTSPDTEEIIITCSPGQTRQRDCINCSHNRQTILFLFYSFTMAFDLFLFFSQHNFLAKWNYILEFSLRIMCEAKIRSHINKDMALICLNWIISKCITTLYASSQEWY